MYMFSRFNAYARAHTHTHLSRGNRTEEKVSEKRKVSKEDLKRTDRSRMTDRNRELVPDSWSLVRERALTTWLCSERWYSEHSRVCRRAELHGRSVKVKKFWKVYGGLMRNDLKAIAHKGVYYYGQTEKRRSLLVTTRFKTSKLQPSDPDRLS